MPGLREEIESAYEEEEVDDEAEEETEEETEEEETSSDGEEAEGEGEDEKDGEEADDSGDDDESTAEKEEPESTGITAPIGYSPESREKWKNVPNVVKEQIHKREQEISQAMQNTAEARRSHSAITTLANNYATVLAAEGANTPMEAIEGLFKTVAELRMGTPQSRAVKMSQLIKHYGVDINMLDQALAGEQVQSTEVTQMSQMLDERLAPLQDMLKGQQNQKQIQQQQAVTEVNTELADFSKNAEFLNDVRHDMADLIDLASKQGRKMGFKEAYDKACAIHPSISKVVSDRATAETLKNSGKRKASKKNASSSLRSGGGSGGADKKPSSLRGEIESLWDSYSE